MPLDLQEVLSQFDHHKTAWIIFNATEGAVVTIPDPSYPGRKPVRFFFSERDCQAVVDALRAQHPEASANRLVPVEVPLIPALGLIASADSFVIHGPNEVFDFNKSF